MAKKGGKVGTKTDAQKAEDFRKIAAKHTNGALRSIARLEKLANGNKYHWTPAQLEKIQTAFKEQLGACFAAFEGKKTAGIGIQL
jgi:hypothetical protein